MISLSVGELVQNILDYFQLDGAIITGQLLTVLAIWALTWLGITLVSLAARRIERVVNDGDASVVTLREKRGQTIAQLVRNVGRVTLLVLAVLLTVNVFIDIGPLLAGLGIGGLAIAFGGQSLVKDVLSGFFMLLEDQFAVGDVISVAGKSGVVERMTMRVVVLRDVEGTIHIVPNSEITTVSNMTRGWARAVLDIGVGYGEDVDRALAVVKDEAARFSEDPAWKLQLDGPVEVWGVESLAHDAVVVRAAARTQPGSQWSVGRELRRRIKIRFDAEGIEIPFPQRTVHFRIDDPRVPEMLGAGHKEKEEV